MEPSTEWVPGTQLLGINHSGRDADHSPPSRAEVKNEWRSTSALPIRLYSVHTDVFIFSIHINVAISSLMLFGDSNNIAKKKKIKVLQTVQSYFYVVVIYILFAAPCAALLLWPRRGSP